jgi:hypothetical protein
MDAARAADASDPDRNYHFSRRWDAPPLKVKRPPLGGTSERAEYEIGSSEREVAKIFERFKYLVAVTE